MQPADGYFAYIPRLTCNGHSYPTKENQRFVTLEQRRLRRYHDYFYISFLTKVVDKSGFMIFFVVAVATNRVLFWKDLEKVSSWFVVFLS